MARGAVLTLLMLRPQGRLHRLIVVVITRSCKVLASRRLVAAQAQPVLRVLRLIIHRRWQDTKLELVGRMKKPTRKCSVKIGWPILAGMMLLIRMPVAL